MAKLTQPVLVVLPPHIVEKARHFANQVIQTVDYTDSNQHNLQKISNDHFISKLGEEAVKTAFENLGHTVTGPDYSIYQAKQKSWEADLYINNYPLAVKTQPTSAAKKYGLSWTFQASGKRKDPVLKQPDAWVCFVACHDNNNEHYHCTVYPPCQIKNLLFKPPRLQHLQGKKLVVYAADLPKHD
ncbi:hypothetical protein C7N43_28655 [Sphingobacteriales bacterium UPWRP_1]|nr:hypothetical protein BVG80_12390 [Sphingobacteriales bacterium TSM_CSM]PSJ73543.1 hypothetical protein C7N43_28655 [Sphingobacteriales bacterium UPWRP_1]